jgi:transposase InsO family protein
VPAPLVKLTAGASVLEVGVGDPGGSGIEEGGGPSGAHLQGVDVHVKQKTGVDTRHAVRRVAGMRVRTPGIKCFVIPSLPAAKRHSRVRVKGGTAKVAGVFEPGDDRMFDPQEFARLQQSMGRPFTLEGACNTDGSNSLIPENHCSPARPFQNESLAGHFLFLNAPFQDLEEFLAHYCQEKEKDPYNTSGCFVVPKWRGEAWNKYLKGMQLVKQYPTGTPLFWARNAQTGERQMMPGIPWEVRVWYDPPRTRARPVQSRLSVVNTQTGEAVQVDLMPDVTMQCKGALMGQPCRVLFDTGAGGSFVNQRFVDRHQLLTTPLGSDDHPVSAADGRPLKSDARVHGRLKLAGLQGRVTLRTMQLDDSYDVILGDDWLREHLGSLDFTGRRVVAKQNGKCYSIPCSQPTPSTAWESGRPPITMLTALQVKRLVRKGTRMFVAHVRESTSEEGVLDPFPSPQLKEPVVRGQGGAPQASIDAVLEEFKEVFEALPPGLPPERPVSHTIPLELGAEPVWRAPYRLSPAERAEVEKQIKHLLEMGYVVPSSSPFGAPILFVPKPDGSLRMCMDFRALNAITVKNKYALPRVDDLLDSLGGATVFSSIDLASGYWQIRLGPDEAPKTAFRTHFGHYEWRVLPFGLCNAPATFQALMNNVFSNRGLGKYVAVYLDDILIYSRSPQEHVQHLREVLTVLREQRLFARVDKCHFNKSELKYLGHVVGAEGIKVDPSKIAAVTAWPQPQNVSEVRSFLGLATYFRRFIQGFSTLARPLYALTRKVGDRPSWVWDATCTASFEGLKSALTEAPVLALPDWSKPFEVVTDASVHGTGAVLLQERHPVSYDSKRFSPAEYNYDTGEQELLGVVRALMAFRCYVEGQEFTLVTDHEPLTYLKEQPKLSRKHARWYGFLSTFEFNWEHRPGRVNVADPLSRVFGSVGCALVHRHLLCAITRGRATAAAARRVPDAATSIAPVLTPFMERVAAGYASDPMFATDATATNTAGITRERDFWWRGDALVVPDVDGLRLECLQMCHASPVGGHFGVTKTEHLLRRSYWWPSLSKDVHAYVSKCLTCQRNKQPNHLPYGEMVPLPVPNDLWEMVSLDLIVKLPKTQAGFDSVLVVVDMLSKYVVFEPVAETLRSEDLTLLLEKRVFAEKGYPLTIISDRDGRCTAGHFRDWCEQRKTEQKLTTAYHSRGNGQTERFNLVLENYLRAFIDGSLSDWDHLLPMAQLAINNSFQESVQNTPFFLNHGRHPYIPGFTTYSRAGVDKRDRREERARWSDDLSQAVAKAKVCLKAAKERMKRHFDKRRLVKEFEVGQRVLLSTRNLKFKGLNSPRLQPRFIGPFTIEQRVGSVSYKLTLPDSMRVHPVFHVELLREYCGDDFTPAHQYECEDGTTFWEVESLLSRRGSGAKRSYLVRWLGFGPEWDTWEPVKHLMEDVPQLVAEFDQREARA